MSLSAGTRLGPYEILTRIGAGGMGEVYKARDTRLDRTVALKILHPGFGSQPDTRQRFEREAHAVSSLNHPHICTLYDIGEQDSLDFLIMEYLDGETVQSRLRKGPMPLDQVIRVGIQLASALHEAHSHGILHRDVKPANIMLAKNGAKLLDFGLAKLRAVGPAPPAGSGLPTLPLDQTEKGTILGTLQYMAPEQLEGKELDTRTDIFALGLVLYEMTTGKRAFPAESQAGLIAGIMRGEYEPVPDAPPGFEHVLERCLARDPADRWHAAADVRLELEWVSTLGLSSAPPAPVKSRRWMAAVAAGALLLGMVASRLWLPPSNPESPVYRFSIAPPPGAEFHRTPNHNGLVLSRDGRALVFLAMRNGHSRLWVQALDSVSARELPGTEEGSDPFWSPDGRSLGFFAGGSLKRIDVDGSNLQVICDIRAPRGASWGSQGDILFAPWNTANGTIFRIPAVGGQPVSVTVADTAQTTYQASPQFLPDGRRFLYSVGGAGTYIGSLDDPKLKTKVIPINSWVQYAQAGLGGPEYLFWHREQNATLVARRWDSRSLQFSGEAIPLAGPVSVLAQNAGFTVSSAGLLAYMGPTDLQAEWRDREGKPLGALGEPGFLQSPRLSPDGRKLAVVRHSALLVTDIARDVTSRVDAGLSGQNLGWSPDSTRLAFARNGAIVIINANGGGETTLTPANGNELACWSPDGRSLLFVDRSGKTGHALWTVPAGSPSQARPILDSTYTHLEAGISPDGRWLAYSSDESGRPEVYVRKLEGHQEDQRTQVSAGGGDFPQWRGDGKELFYLDRDGTLTSVGVQPGSNGLEFAAPKRMFPLPASYVSAYAYDASKDGQRFLVLNSFRQQAREPLSVIVNWPALMKKFAQ